MPINNDNDNNNNIQLPMPMNNNNNNIQFPWSINDNNNNIQFPLPIKHNNHNDNTSNNNINSATNNNNLNFNNQQKLKKIQTNNANNQDVTVPHHTWIKTVYENVLNCGKNKIFDDKETKVSLTKEMRGVAMSAMTQSINYVSNFDALTQSAKGWICGCQHHSQYMNEKFKLNKVLYCQTCGVAVHEICISRLNSAKPASTRSKWTCPMCTTPGHCLMKITKYYYEKK